jgi:NADH-ubiquinone oxidoreductase chain 5
MEGPTPVSALIHAATMVTAGVFLIIRCSSFFEYAPVALNIVSIIGALTAFFAATVGVLQNDIKKVIAYSTCSQLGYMVFICGLSNYPLSLFHLFNHAFFKALLFLGAGAIIHSLSNEQDMRKMGGLLRILPFTYSAMLIASFALMGFPFLSGFYSKDIILEVSYSVYSVSSNFSYLLGTVSAFFTAFYSIRLLFLVFVVKTNAYKYKIKNLHELDFITAVTLTILCLGSCFSGFYFKDLFIGLGSNFFNQAIFIKPNNISLVDSEFLPFYIKLIPSFFSIFGALLSATLFYSNPKLLSTLKITKFGYFFYKYLNQKWYFDQIYNYFIGIRVLKFGYDFTFNLIDKGFIELIGPKGFTQTFYNLSFRITTFQTGFFFHYTCLFLIG